MTTLNQALNRQPLRTYWPIFILSCHRSGSTLLRYLLDSHERLACPPESKFIPALQGLFDYPQALAGLRALGISRDDLALELHLLVERLMTRYTRREKKCRWVDKTPNHYLHTALLERIFQKQVLYLVLARHPLDCISSLERYFIQDPQSADVEMARNTVLHGQGRYAWTQYWLDVYSRLMMFAACCSERCLVITYEDLVLSPHELLRDICAFVGEAYDPEIVSRAFSTKHTPGYGDFKIVHTSGIHDDSVGTWLKWTRPEIEAVWDVVRVQASKFGYTADSAEPLTMYGRQRRQSDISHDVSPKNVGSRS